MIQERSRFASWVHFKVICKVTKAIWEDANEKKLIVNVYSPDKKTLANKIARLQKLQKLVLLLFGLLEVLWHIHHLAGLRESC